jgi:hypothetical protein
MTGLLIAWYHDVMRWAAEMPEGVALALVIIGIAVPGAVFLNLVFGRRRRSPMRHPSLVHSLAATGLPPTEIARRTGLSQDAVALLLRSTGAAAVRKIPPPPAQTAARSSSGLFLPKSVRKS